MKKSCVVRKSDLRIFLLNIFFGLCCLWIAVSLFFVGLTSNISNDGLFNTLIIFTFICVLAGLGVAGILTILKALSKLLSEEEQ